MWESLDMSVGLVAQRELDSSVSVIFLFCVLSF